MTEEHQMSDPISPPWAVEYTLYSDRGTARIRRVDTGAVLVDANGYAPVIPFYAKFIGELRWPDGTLRRFTGHESVTGAKKWCETMLSRDFGRHAKGEIKR